MSLRHADGRPPQPPHALDRLVAVVGCAAVAATMAVGLTLSAVHAPDGLLMSRVGYLGEPLAPFLMGWAPDVRWPLLVAIAVAGLLVAAVPWAVRRVPGRRTFDVVIYLATIALGLAVNASRRGTSSWDHVFQLNRTGSYEASREYLPALGSLREGVAHYVRDFPQLLPGLPTHTKGNPPGPLVAMHLLHITTPGRLAAVCIAVGALCAPLAHRLAAGLAQDAAGPGAEPDAERRGRIAAVLTMFSPSVVIFGVTSVDYAFAALGMAVATLMLTRGRGSRAAGCVLAGIAAFFCWVLLAIPVWAVVCELRRHGLRPAVVLAAGAAAGVIGVTVLLFVVWGYDPIAILHVARGVYGKGAAAHRPWAFWVFGSPAAFLAMLGAPIAWLALRALARGEPAALALTVVIVISAVAGFTKAETERIWLPYVPLACAAAASTVRRPPAPRRLQAVLAALALQAIVVEILFGTTW